MNLPPTISWSDERPGCPILRIDHPLATGAIALLGAHVMEWAPRGAKPVLYMSPDALFAEGSPIRGGVPICWPWFGPKEGLPGHGCVRTRLWSLLSATSNERGVLVEMGMKSDAATREQWPHDFDLRLVAHFGSELTMELHMHHLGAEAAEFSGALHTYLTVGAIERTTVEGLSGATYLDSLEHHAAKSQVGDVIFDREVDRIYLGNGEARAVDASWGRTLRVTKEGSDATVVWNPWIEKSKRLNDLPDEDYHGFLCIEAAMAESAAITLAPGAKHVLATTIAVI